MPKLKMKLRMLFLSCLSLSCACVPTPPENINVEQCIYFQDACICRLYHHGLDFNGPIDESPVIEHEKEYCDKMVGYRTQEYKEVTKRNEEIRIYINEVERLRNKK